MPSCDTFPLLELPHANLEMVLRKLESKSFRRLQQTSWEMWGFVQKNPNVSAFTNGKFFLKTRNGAHSSDPVYIVYRFFGTEVNPKGLYASRLASLDITELNSQLLQAACDYFQKYRITCDHLNLNNMKWRKEEYQTLLKILKPGRVEQIECRHNAYEALYSAATVKNVTVEVDFNSAPQAASIFLSNCQQVKITVPNTADNKRNTSEQLWLFHRILQILHSEPRTNLHRFTFIVGAVMPELPSRDALRIELADFELKDMFGDKEVLFANVALPKEHYFPRTRLDLALRSGKPEWSAGDITYANFSLISPVPQVRRY